MLSIVVKEVTINIAWALAMPQYLGRASVLGIPGHGKTLVLANAWSMPIAKSVT